MKNATKTPARCWLTWSYPTSQNAKKAGHGKTGCWTIEAQTRAVMPKVVAYYAPDQKAQAEAALETLRAGKAVA